MVGDFGLLAGVPNKELARNTRGYQSGFAIIAPQSDAWHAMVEDAWPDAEKRVRYVTKKEGDIFDREYLRGIVSRLPQGYRMRPIDQEIYTQILALEWAQDLCFNFQPYAMYARYGMGIAALKDGVVVSGASSYVVYRDGIEIEVDTREDEQRKGLALACSAALILECLDRGLYPSWDAHNAASLALAKKLGYRFDREYPVYEITEY